MITSLSRMLHVMAVGLLFGATIFFNFIAAPSIFRTFREAVHSAPNDRTANFPLVTETDPEKRGPQCDVLANALAGTAVGPIFPTFYALQSGCLVVAMITALSWWSKSPKGWNRWRVYLLGLALITVVIGWSLSGTISTLRVERFSTDLAVAESAKQRFAEWHLYSLMLSFSTAIFASMVMAMTARIPGQSDSVANRRE
jgi:hypothetical protein